MVIFHCYVSSPEGIINPYQYKIAMFINYVNDCHCCWPCTSWLNLGLVDESVLCFAVDEYIFSVFFMEVEAE